MKRFAAFFAVLMTVLSLAACSGNQAASGGSVPESSSAPEESSSSTSGSEPSGSQPEEAPAAPGGSEAEASQPGNAPEPSAEGDDGSMRVLVAYFSATNTTKGIAERIAAGTGADLYEITPAEPYTSADLNYNDSNSRSTLEMKDPASRPAISGAVADMAQYDVVFLGYPIWWGEAPRIMSTFVESCDLSGKTVVPFCTSGSSGIGSSAVNLQGSTSGASWLPGQRLSGAASQSEIDEWIGGLGLFAE